VKANRDEVQEKDQLEQEETGGGMEEGAKGTTRGKARGDG
jgi:hypothetical protein